jgi:cytochrome c553
MAALAALNGCGDYAAGVPDAFTASGEVIALGGGTAGVRSACITCHGLHGQGDGHLAPRLAGLDRGYLHRQLDAFANGQRYHDDMRRVAVVLSSEDRARVSTYYSSLDPGEAKHRRPPQAEGRDLYFSGDAARGLQPCASCHGERGEGQGAANPPLALQPPAYLAAQLRAWKKGARQNDPNHVMLRIGQALTDVEITAVATLASALSGKTASSPPAASP